MFTCKQFTPVNQTIFGLPKYLPKYLGTEVGNLVYSGVYLGMYLVTDVLDSCPCRSTKRKRLKIQARVNNGA